MYKEKMLFSSTTVFFYITLQSHKYILSITSKYWYPLSLSNFPLLINLWKVYYNILRTLNDVVFTPLVFCF